MSATVFDSVLFKARENIFWFRYYKGILCASKMPQYQIEQIEKSGSVLLSFCNLWSIGN